MCSSHRTSTQHNMLWTLCLYRHCSRTILSGINLLISTRMKRTWWIQTLQQQDGGDYYWNTCWNTTCDPKDESGFERSSTGIPRTHNENGWNSNIISRWHKIEDIIHASIFDRKRSTQYRGKRQNHRWHAQFEELVHLQLCDHRWRRPASPSRQAESAQ